MHELSKRSIFSFLVLILGLFAVLFALALADKAGVSIPFIRAATAISVCLTLCIAGFLAFTFKPSCFFGRDGATGSIGSSSLYAIFCLFFVVSNTAIGFSVNPAIAISSLFAFSAAIFIAPRLTIAKFGHSDVHTLNDFLRLRFRHWLPSTALFMSSFLCFTLLALASFLKITENLTSYFDLSFEIAILLVGFIASFAVVSGGLGSIILISLVSYIVLCLTVFLTTGVIYSGQNTLKEFHLFSLMSVTRMEVISASGAVFGMAGLMVSLGLWNGGGRQKINFKGLITSLILLTVVFIGIKSVQTLEFNHTIQSLPLVLGLLYQLIPAITGLCLLCLSLFAVSTLLGHSLFCTILRPKTTSSLRLAIIRLIWLLSFLIMADIAQLTSLNPIYLTHIALAVSASIIAPVILISLFKKTGNVAVNLTLSAGALSGLLVLYALPETPLLAGAMGAFVACFAGAAGLASCHPTQEEQDIAQIFLDDTSKALTTHQGQ